MPCLDTTSKKVPKKKNYSPCFHPIVTLLHILVYQIYFLIHQLPHWNCMKRLGQWWPVNKKFLWHMFHCKLWFWIRAQLRRHANANITTRTKLWGTVWLIQGERRGSKTSFRMICWEDGDANEEISSSGYLPNIVSNATTPKL